MRLKLDFTGAGPQIIWIIKERERIELDSSGLQLTQGNESTVLPLHWIIVWLAETS